VEGVNLVKAQLKSKEAKLVKPSVLRPFHSLPNKTGELPDLLLWCRASTSSAQPKALHSIHRTSSAHECAQWVALDAVSRVSCVFLGGLLILSLELLQLLLKIRFLLGGSGAECPRVKPKSQKNPRRIRPPNFADDFFEITHQISNCIGLPPKSYANREDSIILWLNNFA
jgi:hypothetical protein